MSKTIFSLLIFLFFSNNLSAQNNPQLSVLLDDGLPYTPQNLTVGDVINYTITLTNSGNVDLSQIVVEDNHATTINTQPIAVLHPGTSTTLTMTYTITQTDLDFGSYSTYVTATARYNGQSLSFQSDDADPASPNGNTDPTITWFIQQPAISLVLDDQLAGTPQHLALGDAINYQLVITNTGNVHLQDIALFINNALFDQNNSIASINPGQAVVINATHIVTASDITIGQVVCQAVGVINLATNPQVFVSHDASANPMQPTPTITILFTTLVNRALLSSVNIYPNPSHQYITITGKDGVTMQEIRIYDIQGHLCQKIALSHSVSSRQIDLSKLSKSMYFIYIKTNKGNLVRRITVD